MSEIQNTIASYLKDKLGPSDSDMRCFVGMTETGEATLEDFFAVGGIVLQSMVQHAIRTERFNHV